MFERFTQEARRAVIAAQTEARVLRHPNVGTEHVLLGLLADPSSTAGAVLDAAGMSVAAARQAVISRVGACGPGAAATADPAAEAAALETIGIDIDRVRAAVEASFGEGALERAGLLGRSRGGHIPFTPLAKKALELSLREALRLKDRSIGSEHILLGLLREGEGLGARLLARSRVDRAMVEEAISDRRRRAS